MTVIKVLLTQSYRKTLPVKYIATAGVRAILYEMQQYVVQYCGVETKQLHDIQTYLHS